MVDMAEDFDPSVAFSADFGFYQDSSGIWRVGQPRPKSVRLPAGFYAEPRPIAFTKTPTFFDQLWPYVTATELVQVMFDDLPLGLIDQPVLDRNRIIEIVRKTPFEPAMRLMVWLQRRIYLHGLEPTEQLETMTQLCGREFAQAGAKLFAASPRRALFSEEQTFMMQRLLLLHATERATEDLTTPETARLVWALLWIPDVMLDPELAADLRRSAGGIDDEMLLRFFVAHGGLAGHPAFRHEMARAHHLYAVIADSLAARRHRDYCPIDDWLRAAYGLGFVELQALGFAFFARSNVGDRADAQLRFTDDDYFRGTAIAGRYAQALPAIAATREWFQAEFSASSRSGRAGKEIQPFLRRPALLQRDGKMVVVGARALESWLGSTGAYYRIFDVARARSKDDMERFRRFNGFLQERYFRHLTHTAHPHLRRRTRHGAAGRVHGETTYKTSKGERKTSDVAVDLGLDLVLVEVTSSRVTTKSLVDGDVNAIVRDLTKVILANMVQLDRVVRDLVAGRAKLPEVDIDHVARIWPIIVSPDSLFHSPSLWAWCASSGGHLLQTPAGETREIQPLVLLDAEEYEILMSIVADGSPLVGVLGEKTSLLWRERDFKSYVLDRNLDGGPDLPFMREELIRSQKALVRVLRGASST